MLRLCIDLIVPHFSLIGCIAKFPINPPTLGNDTTNVASFNDNAPAGNVVFTFCKSIKFIVAQPDCIP